MSLVSKCRPLLDSLNANYGRGNVGTIKLTLAGEGSFIQLGFQMRPRTLKFRIKHQGERLTVYALGHQRTV